VSSELSMEFTRTGVLCQILALFKLCISLPTVSRRIFLVESEVGAYILQ
jgi:hypothetical protein